MGQNIHQFELGSDFLDITGSKSRLPKKLNISHIKKYQQSK